MVPPSRCLVAPSLSHTVVWDQWNTYYWLKCKETTLMKPIANFLAGHRLSCRKEQLCLQVNRIVCSAYRPAVTRIHLKISFCCSTWPTLNWSMSNIPCFGIRSIVLYSYCLWLQERPLHFIEFTRIQLIICQPG